MAEITDERRARVVLSLPKGLLEKVRRGAEAEDLLVGEFIRDALRSQFDEEGLPESPEVEDADAGDDGELEGDAGQEQPKARQSRRVAVPEGTKG